ncbi:hypothetical protein TNCV_3058251 [Trichonephila clavipes]|nr:hypothetical protein TNCV_3058251 [Trichonephila clavipes]
MYLKSDALDLRMLANLHHNLGEYRSFRGSRHSEGGSWYLTHFVLCMEQNVLDTIQRNLHIMLGAGVTCGLPLIVSITS